MGFGPLRKAGQMTGFCYPDVTPSANVLSKYAVMPAKLGFLALAHVNL
jgi:hypothetical protein